MSAKDRIKLLREKIESIVIDDIRNELINCLNVANCPKQSISLVRSMAEKITKQQILKNIGLKPPAIFDACINKLEKPEVMSRGLVPREIISSLHILHIWGNKAVHNASRVTLTLDTVDWIVNIILQVFEWYYVEFKRGPKMNSFYKKFTPKQTTKWQDYLPEINFRKANERFKKHLDQDVEQAISALFLLPEYSAMGGEWCVSKLKKFLTQTYIKHDIKPSIIIDFSTPIKPDKFELLYRIATHTKVNCTNYSEWEECAQTVIRSICNSLRNSEVVFFELKNVHLLSKPEVFLKWFVDEFWTFVKKELAIIAQNYSYIKCICVITTDHQFQSSHPEIIGLPLERWEFEEIKGWLQCYSNISKPKIEEVASTIYNSSLQGIPQLVCEQFYKILPNGVVA